MVCHLRGMVIYALARRKIKVFCMYFVAYFCVCLGDGKFVCGCVCVWCIDE